MFSGIQEANGKGGWTQWEGPKPSVEGGSGCGRGLCDDQLCSFLVLFPFRIPQTPAKAAIPIESHAISIPIVASDM